MRKVLVVLFISAVVLGSITLCVRKVLVVLFMSAVVLGSIILCVRRMLLVLFFLSGRTRYHYFVGEYTTGVVVLQVKISIMMSIVHYFTGRHYTDCTR